MINKELKTYIETNIIPKYNNLDLAHRSNHVYDVIESSFVIAEGNNVNLEMVYVIAAFHDLGLLVDRKNHHIIGGKMLEDDIYLNQYFNTTEISIMKDAVEDHRASTKNKPRSIYGLIISEADLFDKSELIIKRSFLYRMNSKDTLDFEILFSDVYDHISEKYGVSGYLTSWLNSKRVKEMLQELRDLLSDKVYFREYAFRIYSNILKERLS